MSLRLSMGPDAELCMLSKDDASELFELTQQNQECLKEWFMWAHQIHSVTDSLAFIEASEHKFASSRAFDAGIRTQGKLVGVIGFHDIDWNNRMVEIGYWLSEQHRGHGLMTQAVKTFLSFAYLEYQLNRVEIICAVHNQKSRSVAERLGFVFEGFEREGQLLNGAYVDMACYSLLAKEWQKPRKANKKAEEKSFIDVLQIDMPFS
jgi:ribosomal-protein-serine acetyltransferase